MNPIKEIKTDENGKKFTANSFLNRLRSSNPFWWNDRETVSEWVFRGQWDSEWTLTPTAWRDNNPKLQPLLHKISKLPSPKSPAEPIIDDELEYFKRINTEYQAIIDFCKLAEDLGFEFPEVSNGPLQNGFLINSDGVVNLQNHTFIAQHHGIPTRLLDWSKNPLVASYFAVGSEFRANYKPKSVCVWALNTNRFKNIHAVKYKDKFLSPNILKEVNFKSDYIKAQQGLFSNINSDGVKLFFLNEGRFPSLEDVLNLIEEEKKKEQPILYKFILPIEEVDDFLLLLDRENISQAHLMPNLDKVSETVISRWKY